MKYLIKSNWNGWDNKENQKGKEVDLTKEQAEHLTNANVKIEQIDAPKPKDK